MFGIVWIFSSVWLYLLLLFLLILLWNINFFYICIIIIIGDTYFTNLDNYDKYGNNGNKTHLLPHHRFQKDKSIYWIILLE